MSTGKSAGVARRTRAHPVVPWGNNTREGKPILRKLIYPLALLLLNLALVRGLFHSEYIANLGSTEGTFVELTRYLSAHPTGMFDWWPYWECGLPFQNTYLFPAWAAKTRRSWSK